MADLLPLRPVGSPSGLLAVPLELPAGAPLPAANRPRIYLAPLESRLDRRVVRASLAAGASEQATQRLVRDVAALEVDPAPPARAVYGVEVNEG